MKETNIILYSAGAYGNFINWCCDYFSGNLSSDIIPLNDLGNCHNHVLAILLMLPPEFKNYTENTSGNIHQFVQICESSFDINDIELITQKKFNCLLEKNLTYLQQNYKKSIYVYATDTSKVWLLNNATYKIRMADKFGSKDDQFIKEYLTDKGVPLNTIEELISYGDEKLKKQVSNQADMQKNLQKWGHDSINEFKTWELRELLSKYYYDRLLNSITPPDVITELKLKFPHFYFIELDQLRDNFKQTIKNILAYFEINLDDKWNNIDSIHQMWSSKQIHLDKDQKINNIVNSLINEDFLDWQDWNLTLIDEFIIQRRLFDNRIGIKCWELDSFPTNTNDFLSLLDRY